MRKASRAHLALGLLVALGSVAACTAVRPEPDPAAGGAAAAVEADDGEEEAPLASEAAPAPADPDMPVHEGSAVARAISDDALYVADEDHRVLRRVALPIVADDAALEIPLPGAPAQVLALPARLLVTIRDPGLLLVLRPDPEEGAVEVARVPVPADAWGLAVTPDEKTAIVTSAWTHRVTGVDLETGGVRFSLDVAREPRGIVVRPDGASAYVTHLVGTAITRIDGIATAEATARRVDLPPAPLRAPRRPRAEQAELDASLAYAAVLSPDGARLFVARHALGALGKRSWFGQPTVDVLLTADDSPLVPARRRDHAGVDRTFDIGVDRTLSSDGAVPVQETLPFLQPRAAVYRRATRTLLVAGEGDRVIAELDALQLDPSIKPLRRYWMGGPYLESPNERVGCGAPSGIALSAGEDVAYVYCRSSDMLVAVGLEAPEPTKPTEKRARPLPNVFVSLAASPADTFAWKDKLWNMKTAASPPPDVNLALGRRLFYDATDYYVGEVGCAACHPDGRDDGHVHQEIAHGEGFSLAGGPIRGESDKRGEMKIYRGFPRQTPMLAGRVDARGPYGWHGESSTLEKRIQAGFQIHRWIGDADAAATAEKNDYPAVTLRAGAIAAFLRRGLTPPPREERPLTAEEKHGRDVFMLRSTGCASCHDPATGYTDRAAVQLGYADDVPGVLPEDNARFKTPSLRFVGGTPPYFHDGRAPTLEALVDDNHDRMGHTDHLSSRDRAALIAFLRTL